MFTSPQVPLISVIIPAYNQARYVSQSLQSVLNQTYPNFELIVVDDGSTDETPQIIARVQDPRVRVIRQANAGLSAARNTGLRESSAPLVTFLDADDYFLPDKLEVLLRFLEEHPDTGLVAGKARYIDHLSNTLPSPAMPSTRLDLPELLYENPICVSSILMRRMWLERVGVFDETLRACEDWDMWLRLLAAGCPMAWVEHEVVAYRIHPGQMTSQSVRMQKAIFSVLDKFFSQPQLSRNLSAQKNRVYAVALVHAAAYAYLANEFESATRDLAEAVRLDPTLQDDRYKRLIELLVAWAHDPRASDPRSFLRRIVVHLPPTQRDLAMPLRRAVSDVMLAPLFKGTKETWRARKMDLIQAVLYKPDWLLNRGVWRMLVDAWLII